MSEREWLSTPVIQYHQFADPFNGFRYWCLQTKLLWFAKEAQGE
jgi:hypothetical protein